MSMIGSRSKGALYLDGARLGQPQGWRYGVGIYLNFTLWLALGLVLFQLALLLGIAELEGDQIVIRDPINSYILSNLMFVVWGLGLWGVMSGIHRRHWRTLISPTAQIDWGRIGQGFGVWLALIGGPTVLAYGLDPQILTATVDWGRWLPFAGLALIMTPVQTTVEELFFRGYVIQGLSLISRRSGFLCGISALIFALPHLNNPEMIYGFWPLGLYYLAFGWIHAWVTLQDGRLELAMGLHAANNLFAALLITYDNAVIETPALFSSTGVDPWAILWGFLLRSAGFCYLFFPPRIQLREERKSTSSDP